MRNSIFQLMIHTLDPLSEGNGNKLKRVSGGVPVSEVSRVEMSPATAQFTSALLKLGFRILVDAFLENEKRLTQSTLAGSKQLQVTAYIFCY